MLIIIINILLFQCTLSLPCNSTTILFLPISVRIPRGLPRGRGSLRLLLVNCHVKFTTEEQKWGLVCFKEFGKLTTDYNWLRWQKPLWAPDHKCSRTATAAVWESGVSQCFVLGISIVSSIFSLCSESSKSTFWPRTSAAVLETWKLWRWQWWL